MPKNDLIRLQHMLDAAKEAVELAVGKSRHDIESERMLNLSLVRLIEVVGEAANRVPRKGKPSMLAFLGYKSLGCVTV